MLNSLYARVCLIWRYIIIAVLTAAVAIPLLGQEASAWSIDPAANTAVCTSAYAQSYPCLVSDQAGGSIAVWHDLRNGEDFNLYAQRMDPTGKKLWTENGIVVCNAQDEQLFPVAISDSSGNVVVAWTDTRPGDGDVYAQKITPLGVPEWAANGIPVCTANNLQGGPALLDDGAGGVIIAWTDNRTGILDVYAQRLSASGSPQWTANGVNVSNTAGEQKWPVMLSDGAGGAIIAWTDLRDGNKDIYAQRVNATGNRLWAGGVAVCTAAYDQEYPLLVADGSGGAIIGWSDLRSGDEYDIYAQKMDSYGVSQWSNNGLPVCTSAERQYMTGAISDGSGGAILSWTDSRSGDPNVYAQRINASGEGLWTYNGSAVCTATGWQVLPTMVPDGSGGAIIAWEDTRNGGYFYDIYAQRVDPSGARIWASEGIPVSTSADILVSLIKGIDDGNGGAVFAWEDNRGTDTDIYCQRLDGDGHLGVPPGQPVNQAPASAAIGIEITPTLSSSAFADEDSNDRHSKSQWQLTLVAGDYSSPVYDTGSDGTNLTQITIPAGKLTGNVTYYWHVRYMDTQEIWSAWSAETSFTTLNRMPGRPSNTIPAGGAAAISLPVTLQASAFSDPDAGDQHTAAQWRVSLRPGDYSSPAFDSGTDNSSLVQIAVPAGRLSGNATYYWQVRYRDGHEGWSEWSSETSFSTRNQAPQKPSLVSPQGSSTGVSLTPILESSAFCDPDTGDSQGASQWRITSTSGDYSSPVFDSGTDAANLTQLTIPSGTLKNGSIYYWQARHQDSHGDWSPWQEEGSFTTARKSTWWIWLVGSLVGVGLVAGAGLGVGLGRRRRPAIPSSGTPDVPASGSPGVPGS